MLGGYFILPHPVENSTDHFLEDTIPNAVAALTNLGHVTPFYCFDPSSFDDTMTKFL